MGSMGLKNHAPNATKELHSRLSRLQNKHHEICEYAVDAYEAIQKSKEDVPALKEHPHFVDYCVTEEVNNISRMMASGIPMGH